MSHDHARLKRRSALAIAVQLACITGSVCAADAPAPMPFPAFDDGQVVPAEFDEPGATGTTYHSAERLNSDVQLAAQYYCAGRPSLTSCEFKSFSVHERAGANGRRSAYSVPEITLTVVGFSGKPEDVTTTGDLRLVRSCPTDAQLIDDNDVPMENRGIGSGQRPVACVSPDEIPKGASLGVPTESGANQCPIGNAPTVGNPINPLTMSKIETATDYQGPTTSGLSFGRTYHSGSFSLRERHNTVAARYPAGARIGARWRHTYDRAFVRRPYFDDNGNIYTTALHLVREDGSETRFVKKGDGFQAAEGERGTLREDPAGGWVYTAEDLTQEHYDDGGRLASRSDANGNTLTLRYDEITVGIGFKAKVLVSVTDMQGRELRLGYDRLGRVETVDTPDGRVNYSYSGDILEGLDADLTKVGYPDGRSVTYLYDEATLGGTPNHKLTGILGGDGKRFATFRYDRYNRAISSVHGDDLERTEIFIPAGDAAKVDIRREGRDTETLSASYVNGVIRLGQRGDMSLKKPVVRAFDYVGGGLVASATDYLNVPTTYRYDMDRQLEVERIEAAGTPVARAVTTTWHPVFSKPTRVQNGAAWTTYEYDAQGNVLLRREGGLADAADSSGSPWPEEKVTRYTYDDAGRVLTTDGPLSGDADTVTYRYRTNDAPGCPSASCTWRAGDLHTVTNPLGHTATILAYDGSGRVLRSTDANGVHTERRYDPLGRLLEAAIRSNPNGAPSNDDIVTRFTYTANGDIDVATDPDGGAVTHRYNTAHHLVEQIDSLGHSRTIERNPQGQIGSETFVRRNGTKDLERKYKYDGRGLPREIQAGMQISDHQYDANGNLVRRTGFSSTPAFHRDARGRIDRIIEGQGEVNAKTELRYDNADHVKTVVDPNGLETAYLRNGLGDLLWQRSPDTGDRSFVNDESGNPVTETPADSRDIKKSYDAASRLTSIAYKDGAKTTLTYDAPPAICGVGENFAVGRLSSVEDREVTTRFCYDFAGRTVRKSQTVNGVRLDVKYAYTRAGRLSSMAYPSGQKVVYMRDAMGSFTGVEIESPQSAVQVIVSDVRHDALKRLVRWTAGKRNVQRVYGGPGAVTRVQDQGVGGLKINIEYDGDDVSGMTAEGIDGYIFADSASRVYTASALYHPPLSALSNVHEYIYDRTGNRLAWNSGSLVKRTFEYADGSNYLVVADKVLREYDATGNTTRIGDREFVYDSSGRMSQAKVNGVVEMNYSYNALGQQVSRSIAGETTIALHDEEGHWIGDYDGAGRPIRQMLWLDGLPLAALDGEAIRDIQTDQLGTPRIVIDRATDTAIWWWSPHREPFGTESPDEDFDSDGVKYVFDMRFPGQRYDAVTGLHQNGWRDYDPLSGRYIQSDPIGLAGGVSTYAYAGSNPYSRVDPRGLDFVVPIDRNAVKGPMGRAGHSALLVGDDEKGWMYYSKEGFNDAGQQIDVRSAYGTLNDFFAEHGSRYNDGFSITTNRIQDFDARRWADSHINDTYSGFSNNCADFVRGALYAGGLDVSEPVLGPDTPNGIKSRIDFRNGEISSGPINIPWTPERNKPPKLWRK